MSTAPQNPTQRKSLAVITKRYDRVARLYRTLEPLYLIFPPARRKAVKALDLKPGDVVLEIGAGTGRNFPYLVEAVGSGGTVIGVDASAGMLSEALKLIEHHGWSNVELLHQDAAQLQLKRDLDGVLFSLSYSVMPEPRPALSSSLGAAASLLACRGDGPRASRQPARPRSWADRPAPRQARTGRSLLRSLKRSIHLWAG